MNIIFDTENIEAIKSNNVVLELDTFYFSQLNKTATAYCVIDNVKLTDFDKIEQNQRLHYELIAAYKKKDFGLCQDLLEQLIGVFDGEVDSFYLELSKRVDDLKSKKLPDDWSSIITQGD
jgi:hypothetical protein